MNVVISPYSISREQDKNTEKIINPKNYPWWGVITAYLHNKGTSIIQIGLEGEELLCDCVDVFHKGLKLNKILNLLEQCDVWMSVDNFLPHLAQHLTPKKKGIVIFGQSDPLIFGYKDNINILKNRKYLRQQQFWLWSQTNYKEEVFVEPEVIMGILDNYLYK